MKSRIHTCCPFKYIPFNAAVRRSAAGTEKAAANHHYPAAVVQHPASSTQNPATSIQHRASNILQLLRVALVFVLILFLEVSAFATVSDQNQDAFVEVVHTLSSFSDRSTGTSGS